MAEGEGVQGIVQDLKQHKSAVLLAGVGVGVTLFLYVRSKGSTTTTATGGTPSAAGLTQGAGTTSVSTDMLANAMQAQQQQFSSQLTGFEQQVQQMLASAQAGNLGSQQGSSVPGQGAGNATGSAGYPGNTASNPPVAQSTQPWGHIWLSNNTQAFNQFIGGGLVQGAGISPAWAALYVAQNGALPNQTQWEQFLNTNGVRNPQTGQLLGTAGQPPNAAGQSLIRQTFGFGLGFSNT